MEHKKASSQISSKKSRINPEEFEKRYSDKPRTSLAVSQNHVAKWDDKGQPQSLSELICECSDYHLHSQLLRDVNISLPCNIIYSWSVSFPSEQGLLIISAQGAHAGVMRVKAGPCCHLAILSLSIYQHIQQPQGEALLECVLVGPPPRHKAVSLPGPHVWVSHFQC